MRGSLSEVNLALILRDLIRAEKTGRLSVQNGEVGKRIFLTAGALTFAESSQLEEGLAYRLIDAGLISSAVLAEAQGQVAPGSSLAEVLASGGQIDAQTLEREQRSLVELIILGSFDLVAGAYEFQDRATPEGGRRLGLNTPALILEGVRRMFNFDAVKSQMLADERLLRPRVDPTKLQLEPTEGFILSRVDGSYDAATICNLSIISEDMTCRILYGLLAAGSIEYSSGSATQSAPKPSAAASAPPRFEPRPAPAVPPRQAPGTAPRPPVVPPPIARPPVAPPQPQATTARSGGPAAGIIRPRIERLAETAATGPTPPKVTRSKVEAYTPEPTTGGMAKPRVEAYTPDTSPTAATGRPRVEAYTPDASPTAATGRPRVEAYQPAADLSTGAGATGASSAPISPRQRTAEIEQLFTSVGDLEPHAVLGVGRQASAESVDLAFRDLRARFHPSLNTWITDEALRSKLVFVFAKVSAAYHALSDEAQREAFERKYDADAITSGYVHMAFAKTARQREVDGRHHESEELYRQALLAFEGQRLHDARDRILKALKLNDQHAPYYALAARIVMLNPNMRWQKESEGYWRQAIALDRWNADYHVGLGIQYKTAGLGAKARKEFIHALELDPANAVALAEVPVGERPEQIEVPKRADDPEVEPEP